MKKFILVLFVFVLFSCSDSSDRPEGNDPISAEEQGDEGSTSDQGVDSGQVKD